MTSQVFYRKWRPQTLSEVVGQQHVTQTLRNAIASGHIAHAYLFCGPRGTGKTSTGRILAKAVNCLEPVKGEPCNKCQMCRAAIESSALDIIEIDAASNRGIDDIRELRDKVNFSPNQGRYKVYIIDEVHMITKEGANAFLKTLEEPPPHAIFVLATTDPHKVIPTVLSRCQRFDFHRLSQAAVIEKLTFICGKEDIQAEPEVLRLIAKVTTGSLRDAENMLEQAVAYYGHTLELHQLHSMLGISGDLRTRELAKHIINKDVSAGLKTINSTTGDGIDLRQFNRELVSYLRDLLLVKSGSEDVVDATTEDLAEMKNLISGISLNYLLIAVKRFGEIDIRLDNYTPLPLELALISTVLAANEANQSTPLPPQTSQAATAPAEACRPASEPSESIKPAAQAPRSTKRAKAAEEQQTVEQKENSSSPPASVAEPAAGKTMVENPAPPAATDTPAAAPAAPGASIDIDHINKHWKDFVNALRGTGSKGNLDAMLRSACEPVSLEDSILTIGFYHAFHKTYIEDPKYKFLVEKKLFEFFGHTYKIRCIVIEGGRKTKKSSDTESAVLKAALERGARLIN